MFQITWLKIEQRLVDINIELQKALHIENPNMAAAIELLEEFKSMSIAKLMFKKQPQIVETIRSVNGFRQRSLLGVPVQSILQLVF